MSFNSLIKFACAFVGLSILIQAQVYGAKSTVMKSDAVSDGYALRDVRVELGKAKLLQFKSPVKRIAVADPTVLDALTISSTEIYLVGRETGYSNILIWYSDGKFKSINTEVFLSTNALSQAIKRNLSDEKNIKIAATGNSIIMSGSVSDAVSLKILDDLAQTHACLIADRSKKKSEKFDRETGMNNESKKDGSTDNQGQGNTQQSSAFSGQEKVSAELRATKINCGNSSISVINLVSISSSQQVMLEVKIAEIRKDLLEQLGVGISATGGNVRWRLITQASTGGIGLATLFNGLDSVSINAEKKDALVKILAEPTIVSMSGEVGSFLAGGKLLIPVNQSSGVGSSTVTLREQDYGIGLSFLPIVGKDGVIRLKVTPEVTEIASSPLVYGSGLSSTIIPAFTTRKVSTTVQIKEGQSLVIGGLLSSTLTETIRAIPLLGEIPVLGALFRSSDYVNAKTELVVIVSPKLAKANDFLVDSAAEKHIAPSRSEFFLKGKLEGESTSKIKKQVK